MRASPNRLTHQMPPHSLCKTVQLKGIDLQVNIMVLICAGMVFGFNWLLLQKNTLAVIKEAVGDPLHNTLYLLGPAHWQTEEHIQPHV